MWTDLQVSLTNKHFIPKTKQTEEKKNIQNFAPIVISEQVQVTKLLDSLV